MLSACVVFRVSSGVHCHLDFLYKYPDSPLLPPPVFFLLCSYHVNRNGTGKDNILVLCIGALSASHAWLSASFPVASASGF